MTRVCILPLVVTLCACGDDSAPLDETPAVQVGGLRLVQTVCTCE